ncbi:MAG: hypothetical protein AAGK78_09485, partial [Planctomycetota bacterium]
MRGFDLFRGGVKDVCGRCVCGRGIGVIDMLARGQRGKVGRGGDGVGMLILEQVVLIRFVLTLRD